MLAQGKGDCWSIYRCSFLPSGSNFLKNAVTGSNGDGEGGGGQLINGNGKVPVKKKYPNV